MESALESLSKLSNLQMALSASAGGLCVYLLVIYRKYKSVLGQYNNLPGTFTLLGNSDLCFLLPDIPNINKGFNRDWTDKHTVYEQLGSDVISMYSMAPWPGVSLYTCDATLIKQIITNRAAFPKPVQYYDKLQIYGANIVTTEGADWKRHRRISAPAFSERNNAMVHEETKKIILELFDIWKETGQMNRDGTVEIDDMRNITTDLALQVIATAGFGYGVSWKNDEAPPAGHNLTFKSALSTTLHNLAYKVVLPRWALRLFSTGKQTITAFDELEQYMSEMIQSRKETPDSERADLLTNLLGASMGEAEDNKGLILPSEAELMGNIYIFLLAGHETTARALAFSLALLGLHQDIQQKVLEEVEAVVGRGQLPTYAHVTKLKYTEAVLFEALRQYPLVGVVPKSTETDTVVTTTNPDGTTTAIPVPAKTAVMISVIGTHYNPKFWPDPYKFDPERFLKPYNKDAFIPFSAGPRACIGRRFSEVEAITAIAMFVAHFHIGIKEGSDIIILDETGRPAINAAMGVITMSPTKVPLVLRRRTSGL